MDSADSMNDIFDLVVVGGGAAGFFGAIQAAEMKPGMRILILERSSRLLAKVKVSGGGRCNVTHHCFNPFELADHYPRGEKKLKAIFKVFQASDMVAWLTSKGVDVKAEADGRMFPVTDSAQTIIDCFLKLAFAHKIQIELALPVEGLTRENDSWTIHCPENKRFRAKHVLIAIGGNPNPQFYAWIQRLGHTINPPIPSLFTFNDTGKTFTDLMGVAVPDAEVRIATTKYVQRGPVLITHWGLSGPAVIKLSAWAAEYLHQRQYQFTALVSWIGPCKEDEVRTNLAEHKTTKGKQKVINHPLFGLPTRLWEKLCALAEIDEKKIWAELPSRNLNKLLEFLIRCPFQIKGKTTFKEEFVTCGGVDLKEIDLLTMQSRIAPGVFFAGEVLHIDGETGGFNFQAAWSTAFLAASTIANENC